MKKLSEVLEALGRRWDDAPLKDIDGFSYIPWEATDAHMNEVFGPLGWSDHTTPPRLDEAEVQIWVDALDERGDNIKLPNGRNKRYPETRLFKGYVCTVELEVQVFDDVYGTGVIRVTKSAPGFGAIQGQGEKNALDTPVKAAGSDAFSKAAKKLGDAFGLFLYSEKKRSRNSSGSSGQSGTTNTASGASGKASKPTAKQLEWLNKKGLPQDIIDALDYDQGKAALDALFAGETPKSVVQDILKMEWTAPAKKGDKLPIPA